MRLSQDVAKLIEEHTKAQASEIVTLKSKISKLTRQRDEARGRANEYRSYAAKYQKELAARRRSDRI